MERRVSSIQQSCQGIRNIYTMILKNKVQVNIFPLYTFTFPHASNLVFSYFPHTITIIRIYYHLPLPNLKIVSYDGIFLLLSTSTHKEVHRKFSNFCELCKNCTSLYCKSIVRIFYEWKVRILTRKTTRTNC